MLPEEVDSQVTHRKKKRVKKEYKYGQEMKRIGNWEMEEISILIHAFIESFLFHIFMEKQIFIMVIKESNG